MRPRSACGRAPAGKASSVPNQTRRCSFEEPRLSILPSVVVCLLTSPDYSLRCELRKSCAVVCCSEAAQRLKPACRTSVATSWTAFWATQACWQSPFSGGLGTIKAKTTRLGVTCSGDAKFQTALNLLDSKVFGRLSIESLFPTVA